MTRKSFQRISSRTDVSVGCAQETRQEVNLSTNELSKETTPSETFSQGRDKADQIARLLKQSISAERFELWFESSECIAVASTRVIVSAPDQFSLVRIQNTFRESIRKVVDLVCGPQFQLVFEILQPAVVVSESSDSDLGSENQAADEPVANIIPLPTPVVKDESRPAKKQSDSKTKRPVQGVNSFWFGDENKLARAAVDQVFENPGQLSPLVLYGPPGCGKTHLLTAICNDYRRRNRGRRCVMLSAEQFTSYFVQSLRGSGLPMFRRKYRDLDVLAIDDIHFFAGKRATLVEFQYTIDNLTRMGKQVIVSTDRPPAELDSLDHELVTRLTGGLACPLQFAGLEGRIKIANKMCNERKFFLAKSVLEQVCERVRGDVRRLSGAINLLNAMQVSSGNKITTSCANEILNNMFSETQTATSLVRIEKVVCEICRVKPVELKSSSRKKRICTARMLAMYLSREHTTSAYSEIGDYFGGRSHSTVIAAQRKVNLWLSKDEAISLPHATFAAKDILKRIESELKTG